MQYSLEQEHPWRDLGAAAIARIMINATSLLAVALLAFVLWRVEVESHGWHGLTWLSYFHWAIPIGAIAFVAWLACSAPLPKKQRLGFAVIVTLAMLPLYELTKGALVGAFAREWYLATPDFEYYLRRLALIPCFVGVPLLFWGAARYLGVHINWIGRSAGALCYFGGPLLSIMLLELLEHRGTSDFIHAIKSGYLIPFTILGLGLPIALAIPTIPAKQTTSG